MRALRVVKGCARSTSTSLTERAGIDGFLRQGGIRVDTTGMFGVLVYWLVILAALVIAFNGLGLTYITDLLGRVLLFVPKVIVVALLVLGLRRLFRALRRQRGGQAYCRNVHCRTPSCSAGSRNTRSWPSWC